MLKRMLFFLSQSIFHGPICSHLATIKSVTSSKFVMAENHLLIPVRTMVLVVFLTLKRFIKRQAAALYLCLGTDLNSHCLDLKTHRELLMSRQSVHWTLSVSSHCGRCLYQNLMLKINGMTMLDKKNQTHWQQLNVSLLLPLTLLTFCFICCVSILAKLKAVV